MIEVDVLELRLRGTSHAVPLRTVGAAEGAQHDGHWHFDAAADLVEPGNAIEPDVPARFSFFVHGDERLILRSSIGASTLPPGSTYALRLYDLSGRFLVEHRFPLRSRSAVLDPPGVPGRGCIVISLPGPAIVAPLRLAIDSAPRPAEDDDFALVRLPPGLRFVPDEAEPPHPWFMPNWYRRFGQERLRRTGSALLDYAQRGTTEPLPIHPLFDPEWYAATHAISAGDTPLKHFARGEGGIPNRAAALALEIGGGTPTAPDALPDDPERWLANPPPPPLTGGTPALSIVLPLAGRLGRAEPAIEALLRSEPDASHEIVLVEHGVAPVDLPRLWEWLRLFPRLRLIRADGPALNAGATAARAAVLALLDPGTIVKPGRLARLRGLLNDAIAAVQPVTVHADQHLRSAGRAPRNRIQDVAALTGECVVLRRADFLGVGGLDDALAGPAAFADLGDRLCAATGRALALAELAVLECREDAPAPLPAGLPPLRTAPRPVAAPRAGLRIAIKVAHASGPIENSGDYHFATALAAAFRALGHTARIDRSADWYRLPEPVDVALVLRGRTAYRPRAHHLNLAWLISHPDEATPAELAVYDHVFAASAPLADRLAAAGLAASPLLQCTDPGLFHPGKAVPAVPRLIFVGNSRQVFRAMPATAMAESLPLELYGRSWEKFGARQFLRGITVANARLPDLYRAGIVFNDHWQEMAEAGILSNRLFDAAACASPVISDPVAGIAAIFDDLVETVMPGQPIAPVVARLVAEGQAQRRRRLDLAARIAADHSFAARARTIVEIAYRLYAQGLAAKVL